MGELFFPNFCVLLQFLHIKELDFEQKNHHFTNISTTQNTMNKFCIVLLASSFALAYAMPEPQSTYKRTQTSGKNCKTIFDIERVEKFEKKCETIYV